MIDRLLLPIVLLLVIVGCAPRDSGYHRQYAHLREARYPMAPMVESDCFVVFLVEARHLDYRTMKGFLRTMSKHPSDGSMNGDVGHAWIYLQGCIEGKCIRMEGGHSGEMGELQPRYCDGIMNYYDYGERDARQETVRYEPNPVKYLWEPQCDGFFQRGGGGHYPTYAAKKDLTQEQFEAILTMIKHYAFEEFSLTGNQCTSFVAAVAERAGVYLEHEVELSIPPKLVLRGETVRLWEDPCYSRVHLGSPDILERSLMQKVSSGDLTCALGWYRAHHRKRREDIRTTWRAFPSRCARLWALY